jgi:4-hydroxymandelate oxidase
MTLTRDAEFDTLSDIREAALAKLEPMVREFLEGGAGDEVTLRRNRRAFERWAFSPRTMSGRSSPSTRARFMGLDLDLPILTAPFGADGLFDPDGHLAVAKANSLCGVVSIIPEAGTHSLEALAVAAPRAAAIGQMHPLGSEENFLRMVRRYENAGYRALCITCDSPTGGWRERIMRSHFIPDMGVVAGNYATREETVEDVFGQLFDVAAPVWSWSKLGSLLAQSSLPWMAKGIMTVRDAQEALAAGASALLISNHGGRQLDDQLSSLEVLPKIRDAVGNDIEIALDSGVRRGADIVKAVALGADVVVLGRLAVYGLAAGGEEGVRRTHELLEGEIRTILTLLGHGDIADLDRQALQPSESA